MTKKPQDFAGTPAHFDLLSQILEAIHLRGGTVAHHLLVAGTTWESGPGQRVVHLIERGPVQVEVDAGGSRPLDAGDMVLLPHGSRHLVAADKAPGSWVTGTFLMDDALADSLLGVLPAAITVGAGEPGNTWLSLSRNLLLAEMREERPGAQAMISRILDLLFIHALRAWAANGDVSPGWLTAAMDTVVGPVVSTIHKDLPHQWTVEEMASQAGLSRSAFSSRFSLLLGTPPMAYLAHRRLEHAANLLSTTSDAIGQIASRVGYTSEAAFSRAFRRRFGVPPRTWARQSREPGAT